ncbi:unnamed protein product [Alternaria alternata]
MSLQHIVGAGACEACRGRITKSSVRPVAIRRRHHGQVYSADASRALERIFAHLRTQPRPIAHETLGQLRRGTNVHAVLRFLEYGSLRLQLMLVPDTTYQFTLPYLADMMPLFDGTDNPYLTSRLYKALSHETAHHGTEIQEQTYQPIYHVPYPGARMYDPRMSPNSLRPSRWTSISHDDVFLTRLLEDYFLYEFPLWPCFHKDHFLDDMATGRTDYCSPLLVNTILTAACHGAGSLKQRSEFWNPDTYSYRFSCFYLMKPPLSRIPPEDGLPDYRDAQNFFGEIWIKYPLATHLVPIYLGQTFLALIKLRYIMNDIAGKALPEGDGQNDLDLQQASRYHAMLVQWFHDLPEPLQSHNIAMPTQLLLHMQFHNLVTMTFQPFLQHETSSNQPHDGGAFEIDAGFSPARLYAASKASLQTLLHMFYHRHGFEAYYVFLLQIFVQLGFDSIERLRTPEARQEHFPAKMKATRATLILCAKGLHDQGRNFFLSELVFRILRDKMDPVDVKLLKDWARIEDENRREKLMLEHVHSEYPVNVGSISSDPTDQRLNRLLQSMGDLKLPNDTAEPLQPDRTSRTWRSIVF